MPRLNEFEEDGLIELSDALITVTNTGRLMLRQICMVFDEYLSENNAGGAKFSKAM
jgi:oxygen-independent coproporphyrinogen-3 oxidase